MRAGIAVTSFCAAVPAPRHVSPGLRVVRTRRAGRAHGIFAALAVFTSPPVVFARLRRPAVR